MRKKQTQNKSGNVYSNNHSSLVNEYFTQVHPEGDGADPDKEIVGMSDLHQLVLKYL